MVGKNETLPVTKDAPVTSSDDSLQEYGQGNFLLVFIITCSIALVALVIFLIISRRRRKDTILEERCDMMIDVPQEPAHKKIFLLSHPLSPRSQNIFHPDNVLHNFVDNMLASEPCEFRFLEARDPALAHHIRDHWDWCDVIIVVLTPRLCEIWRSQQGSSEASDDENEVLAHFLKHKVAYNMRTHPDCQMKTMHYIYFGSPTDDLDQLFYACGVQSPPVVFAITEVDDHNSILHALKRTIFPSISFV